MAKATDGGQVPGQFGTFNGTDSPIDPYNRKLEYALSDLDQRQRFVASLVCIPQFTRNISNKPLRLIADGFVMSTIVTVATGQPVTGSISGNVAGAIAGGPTGGAVNNSGTALGGRPPGIPRNSYTGPGLGNVDFRISREFKFTERSKADAARRGIQPVQLHQLLHREHPAVYLHRGRLRSLRRSHQRMSGSGVFVPDA